MKIKFLLVIFILSGSNSILTSQERTKDTIGDQVVNVVKPYKPTISDAFKIKDNPRSNDTGTVKRKR
jgi:hypothetical protein